jgi:hypothetical protein
VHVGGDDVDAVLGELRATAGAQIRRVQTVMAEDAMHLMGRVVARGAAVEDQDATARAAEDERGVQAGGSGADDDAVPGRVHQPTLSRSPRGCVHSACRPGAVPP